MMLTVIWPYPAMLLQVLVHEAGASDAVGHAQKHPTAEVQHIHFCLLQREERWLKGAHVVAADLNGLKLSRVGKEGWQAACQLCSQRKKAVRKWNVHTCFCACDFVITSICMYCAGQVSQAQLTSNQWPICHCGCCMYTALGYRGIYVQTSGWLVLSADVCSVRLFKPGLAQLLYNLCAF